MNNATLKYNVLSPHYLDNNYIQCVPLTYFKDQEKKIMNVRCGVRTHAHIRVPELKSGALDHSANLTWYVNGNHFLHDNHITKFICLDL